MATTKKTAKKRTSKNETTGVVEEFLQENVGKTFTEIKEKKKRVNKSEKPKEHNLSEKHDITDIKVTESDDNSMVDMKDIEQCMTLENITCTNESNTVELTELPVPENYEVFVDKAIENQESEECTITLNEPEPEQPVINNKPKRRIVTSAFGISYD